MEIFRFKNWKVYKESKDLFKLLLKISDKLPKDYKYSIGSQVLRSGLSIILNIAEGSGKDSDKELNRYFNISIGSINETLAFTDTLTDLGLITATEFQNVYKLCESISRQLGGFKRRLKEE